MSLKNGVREQLCFISILYSLQATYISVMRNTTTSNRDHFESLLSIYREADTVQERERILRECKSQAFPSSSLIEIESNNVDPVQVSWHFLPIQISF